MSKGLKFKVDPGDVLKNMAKLSDSIAAKNLETATRAGALLILNSAKQKVRYKTGTLRRSLHMETAVATRNGCKILVGTDLKYAKIHEYGGTVKAKGRYLVFVGQDGKKVFVKSVTIKAQPYMRPAIDENRSAVAQEIGDALRALLGGAI